jgi:hypothetical protein
MAPAQVTSHFRRSFAMTGHTREAPKMLLSAELSKYTFSTKITVPDFLMQHDWVTRFNKNGTSKTQPHLKYFSASSSTTLEYSADGR